MTRLGLPRVPSSLTLRIPLRPSDYKYLTVDSDEQLGLTEDGIGNRFSTPARYLRWRQLSTGIKAMLVTLATLTCIAIQVMIVLLIRRQYAPVRDTGDLPDPYPWRKAFPIQDWAPLVHDWKDREYSEPYADLSSFTPCEGPEGMTMPLQRALRNVPIGHPKPAFGSYDLINYSAPCMTYEQRYAPYQLENNNLTADWRYYLDKCFIKNPREKRQVVLIRAWQGFIWKKDDLLNLRALITELGLNTGGLFDIAILVEVKDGSAYLVSESERAKILKTIPREIRGLVHLWSEHEMHGLYPGLSSVFEGNPIHGAYRGLFMAAQKFALDHPEYDYVWHWELDIRYTGNYYEFFHKSAEWARKEPFDPTQRRSSKYLIPGFKNWTLTAGPLPPKINAQEADLITFNIIFDQKGSKWVFERDLVNYPNGTDTPRRGSIITASRLSRRLLLKMNQVNGELRQATASEAFPATVALHYGLKAVFVPHPVYQERLWDPEFESKYFNAPDLFRQEDMFEGTTYYYRNWHARDVYMRWRNDEKTGSGEDICRKPLLLHPIKEVLDVPKKNPKKEKTKQPTIDDPIFEDPEDAAVNNDLSY